MYRGGSLRFASPAIVTSAALALGVLISPAGAAPAGEAVLVAPVLEPAFSNGGDPRMEESGSGSSPTTNTQRPTKPCE